MSLGPVRPLVGGIILCDDVQAQLDDSLHLLHVRHQVQATEFPHIHPQLCVYLELTGHRATDPCVVVAADGGSEQEVFRSGTHAVRFDGPLTVTPVLFRLRHCPFSAPGLYWIQFYWREQLLAEHRLQVLAI